MGLNIQKPCYFKSPPPTNWGAPGQVSGSRGRYPRRSSAAEVSRGSVGRGSRGLRSLRAPPPGLSHGVARVPTRGCCGERRPDAAGPGAQRGAPGRPPACPPGAAARDCSGQSAACEPWASMAFTRKRQREQQLQLYSKERCAGREAGPGGSRGLSCRPRPPPGPQSRARVGPAGGGAWGREGRAVPAPARPPSHAGVSPPTLRALHGRLLGKRVRRGGRGQPRPREDVGRAPASLRSRPRTGKRTSAPWVPPRAVGFVTQLWFQRERGLHFCLFVLRCGFVCGSRDPTVTLLLSGSSEAGYARKCRCSFYSGCSAEASPVAIAQPALFPKPRISL